MATENITGLEREENQQPLPITSTHRVLKQIFSTAWMKLHF